MRLIARYAKDLGEEFEVITVYENKTFKEKISKKNPSIKTIAKKHPSAIWCERKMSDDFGIIIEDAFDVRPLSHQERFPKNIYPMLKDFKQKNVDFSQYIPYKYEEIKGDGVFQVAVGPIHAGIIEPGHFQFSQAAEEMLHLEVRHFYTYRAIEKMLEGKTLFEAKEIIERISGNESIAYQIAWIDILAQASKKERPKEIQKQHALLLEIERIIHHLTDLGFIPNDAGFSSALAFCSKLSEDARRKLKEITGHRFGFGSISLNSIKLDIPSIETWLNKLKKEVEFFEDWIIDMPSLWDRFDTTGTLLYDKCIKYDVVGVMARASGIVNDRRISRFYLEHGFEAVSETTGDVGARFKVRVAEVKNSITLIHNFLTNTTDTFNPKEINDGQYTSFTESSIGELFMSIDIKDGIIDRFFVRDASFMNWQVVHLLMNKDIIADFPLINKSCDLSYAGNDL